jgi:hypothetical protein
VTFADAAIQARRALLDALAALGVQRDAVVLVGAHAVYVHTGDADVPIASYTKDADLLIVPGDLQQHPTLDQAMRSAGFSHDEKRQQPGEWTSPDGHVVEFLVPDGLHTGGGRRGARIAPHSSRAARVVSGLEAAAVDHARHLVGALVDDDPRAFELRVAGPAALIVAKTVKIGERHDDSPHRLIDKDAHDLYRLLRATETRDVAARLTALRTDPLAGAATERALSWLGRLSSDRDSPIPRMAGAAEQLVGDPAAVSAATAALVQDLLDALGS